MHNPYLNSQGDENILNYMKLKLIFVELKIRLIKKGKSTQIVIIPSFTE